jgi:preprotein translocase subunit SecF
MQFIPDNVNIDFVGKRRVAAIGSAILVLASLILFLVVGPNWGIDFTGGAEIRLKFTESEIVEIGEVRQAIEAASLPGDSVQSIGSPEDNEYSIRVQDAAFGSDDVREQVKQTLSGAFGADWIVEERFDAEVGANMTLMHGGPAVPLETIKEKLKGIDGLDVRMAPDDNTFYVKLPGLSQQVEEALALQLSGHPFEVLQVDSVGPKVGGDLRRQGFISIFATLVLVLVYVAFRFDLTFAPGAVIALFHDVTIVIGVFVLIQREVNISIIGALLTIIGYSLNDTIVIYDRIRENMERYRRKDMEGLINTSVNETLNRTLNTSLTTLAAMLVFLFMGGPVIETFALAIALGVIVGTYSTVYVASPMILIMQDVKPYLVRLMTMSNRSSPEQAAGVDQGEGKARGGRLRQKGDKPESERDLFKNL